MTDLEQSTGVTNPLVLLQSMVDKGATPDLLEKMIGLAERWQHNQAVQAFNEAMQRAQARMPVVIRDTRNEHTKKNYAPLEAVNNVIKPVYTEEGFSLIFTEEEGPAPDGHIRMMATVLHKLGHSMIVRGVYALDKVGMQGKDNKTLIQAKVSSDTYARRDLTCLAFNVTVQDADRDGNALGGYFQSQHIKAINELIDECEELARTEPWKKVDYPRLLEWLCPGAQSLEDIPAVEFPKAISFLNQLRKRPKPEPKPMGKGGAK